jgi:hypothetical protein
MLDLAWQCKISHKSADADFGACGPVLEFACHEANYSLTHILEGARERERRAQQ